MIDLHAHVLPGLDDGPRSVDEALALARAAVAAGVSAMATTTHVSNGYAIDSGDIAAGRAALAARLAEEGVALELLQGGEVAPDRLPELSAGELDALTLGTSRCVLLECPFIPVGGTMAMLVEGLHGRGYEVLLAHPERSPSFQREPDRLAALVAAGAYVQVTIGSLVGAFGDVPRRAALAMIERGHVHVLASDAHAAAGPRAPGQAGVLEALEPQLGDGREWLGWATGAAPAAIAQGAAVPAPPPLARPRGMRARLRSWSAR